MIPKKGRLSPPLLWCKNFFHVIHPIVIAFIIFRKPNLTINLFFVGHKPSISCICRAKWPNCFVVDLTIQNKIRDNNVDNPHGLNSSKLEQRAVFKRSAQTLSDASSGTASTDDCGAYPKLLP